MKPSSPHALRECLEMIAETMDGVLCIGQNVTVRKLPTESDTKQSNHENIKTFTFIKVSEDRIGEA